MAVFGPFSTVRAQLGDDARFAPALAYLAEVFDPRSAVSFRISQLPVGASERVELSQGSFAIEQIYLSRLRPEGFFESHQKYIDVQVMVAGEELMEVEDITRLTGAEAYFEPRDFIKYADTTTASRLRMRAGDVAVFFPVDGHMPCLQLDGPVLVRKTVVKVPVGEK
jgi:YhcH/YjgK/YiaL family protein